MGNPFRKLYNIKTKTTGTRTKGSFSTGTETTSTVSMSVQPMTGRELDSLSIGQKNVGKVKLYTDELLIVARQGENYTGDIVEFQGSDYEIIGIEPNQSDIINHRKYIGEYRGKTA